MMYSIRQAYLGHLYFEKFQKRLLRPLAELARLLVRSLRWVSGYRIEMADSIKRFSSYPKLISWRFRRFPAYKFLTLNESDRTQILRRRLPSLRGWRQDRFVWCQRNPAKRPCKVDMALQSLVICRHSSGVAMLFAGCAVHNGPLPLGGPL